MKVIKLHFLKQGSLALLLSLAYYPFSISAQQLDFPHDQFESQHYINRIHGGTTGAYYEGQDTFDNQYYLDRVHGGDPYYSHPSDPFDEAHHIQRTYGGCLLYTSDAADE